MIINVAMIVGGHMNQVALLVIHVVSNYQENGKWKVIHKIIHILILQQEDI